MFCRCRPLNKEETSARHSTVIDFNASKDGDLGILTGGSTKKTFRFDRVYTPNDDQGVYITLSAYRHNSLSAYSYIFVKLCKYVFFVLDL